MSDELIKELSVFLNLKKNRRRVGSLAFFRRKYYFEYDADFVKSGLQISPFLMPLKYETFSANEKSFSNPFGVFCDSMPDGWGMLLLSRKLERKGINASELSFVELLSFVGKNGMGALEYEPFIENSPAEKTSFSFEVLSEEVEKILDERDSAFLDVLLENNGSSCGARPKIATTINGEPWIVKLLSSMDDKKAGVIEYAYSLAAKKAGIDMLETKLFESQKYPGFFGIKRFDRANGEKIHMHSACGLLDADFRAPSLEYENLIMAAKRLTQSTKEAEKVFRLMAFNVKSHNLDDHSKNFSFLMNEKGEWRFSPAYDLTCSPGVRGHRMTSVNGKTKDITNDDLSAVAKKCGVEWAKDIIDSVEEAINEIPALIKSLE